MSAKISRIATVHEISLDLTAVERFSQFAASVALPSESVVSVYTHYLE